MKKPSVTELLNLLDKPALLYWANKQGLNGIDIKNERSKWLSTGASIHTQIENYIRNGEPFISQETQSKFNIFQKDKKILSIESDIETEYFVGRYDMKVMWNNKVYIMDFKTNHKAIYLENRLQLVAYSMAEECDSFAIVSVPEFSVMNFKIENRTPYIELLKSLSNIYKLKKEIENG